MDPQGAKRQQVWSCPKCYLLVDGVGVASTMYSRRCSRTVQIAVYVVGMANVGKSTMLNRLVDVLERHQPFTASRVPGYHHWHGSTRVTLPNGDKTVLVDTPGLIHGDRVIDKLCGTCSR